MNAKGSRVGLSSPASATSYASRRTAGSCWLMLTNKPDDSGSLRKKVLKGAAERAKIHGLIGWHSLRHSYRAWLDETGAPLGVQQKLMRHANIATTMNVYGGAFMEAKRKANTSVVQRVLLQDHTK